ncbi:iron export ABC transporter permease subunit FetB [Deinococcus sp.]|uniref:ABC transporter permease n=1 Tax=Deinococcus sp. TaxID=47478 RepID=UPI0025B96CA3|nr:iron export ABC transporter permease subunit FetB [Deinococcus sp.]
MSLHIALWQVAASAALLLVSIGLSWWLKLGLGREILVAGVRMTVQLLLVGLILAWVFALKQPLPVVAIGLVMTLLAAQASSARPKYRYRSLFLDSFVAIFGSSFLLTGLTLSAVLRIHPWFEPQYAVPILGMILGNSVTSVALGAERFTADLHARRGEVEGQLLLGATRWEAAHPLMATAVKTGMLPTLNSMTVMGIVSLPGMMTGQILAGESPQNAVHYQLVMMFVLAASSALGSLGVVLLAYHRLFDNRDRLRLERLGAERLRKPASRPG